MKELKDGQGMPRSLLLMMAVVGGLTVANLYYNQPLLEEIRADLDVSETAANLITVITQVGYAIGLLLIIPMADIWSRRKIVGVSMTMTVLMAATIAMAPNVWAVWIASIVLGACSVIPQIFVPMAGQYSRPDERSQNMGIVQSGVLTGVLGARVVSGYLGGWLGWRIMFGVVALVMATCLVVTLRNLPRIAPSFHTSYPKLLRTIGTIFREQPRVRVYSLRAAFSFGSMMTVWSCLAFHLAGDPFHASSDRVGMLGLCGLVGAMAASVVGKYIPRFGIQRLSVFGAVLQVLAWTIAYLFGDTYAGLIATIMLVDAGAQCQQLSNQSGCLAAVHGASNRTNTIFMVSLFIGGGLGTFAAGNAWTTYGWTGICLVGIVFACCSLLVSAWLARK